MNPQLTWSQRQWLHSSVGKASHRYREVTGSNPVEVLNFFFFFQASLRNCINCVHCDDHFFIFISFPQFIYDLFHISLTKPNMMPNVLNYDWGIAISPPIACCGVDVCLPILAVLPLYLPTVQTRKIKFSSLWFSTTTFRYRQSTWVVL